MIDKCRSCLSTELTEVLNLGEQYTSDFRTDDSKPPKYLLVAVICEKCKLVQLNFSTPPSDMYHSNYGFKSGISNSIKKDLKENVGEVLKYKPRTWLDIASNDGTLLSFVPENIYRVGVDPIEFLCEEATQYADKIVNNFFDVINFVDRYDDFTGEAIYEQFDAITSISCFYDMDDPNEFVKGVSKILAKGGVWDIQQNYLLTTLELSAVDNFCHEHLEYYTLLSLESLLERHGLEIVDLSTSMVNGGSLRTFVAHKGDYPIQNSVEKQRVIELKAKLDETKTYTDFAKRTMDNIEGLRDFINKLNQQGKSIVILAASTRGATIWQAAEINYQIKYAVERNPEKIGKNFSAIGIPIISEKEFRKDQPDYALIGPWFYADEIIEREKAYLKKGGKFIKPLPKVTTIEHLLWSE